VPVLGMESVPEVKAANRERDDEITRIIVIICAALNRMNCLKNVYHLLT
jgi:hypothetical protein